MQYEPKSEEQLNKERCIPEGTYPFEVVESRDRVSKSGKEMIEIKMKVYDDEHRSHLVYDYFLSGIMEFKLRHFCVTTNMLDRYEGGSLGAEDCIGRSGMIIISHSKDKEDPDKIWVKAKDYEKSESAISKKPAINVSEEGDPGILDDDIPF